MQTLLTLIEQPERSLPNLYYRPTLRVRASTGPPLHPHDHAAASKRRDSAPHPEPTVARLSLVTSARDADLDCLLDEAPARLALERFSEAHGERFDGHARAAFVRGYRLGARGSSLDRGWQAQEERSKLLARAFAYGWCHGRADLQGCRPALRVLDHWLWLHAGGPPPQPRGCGPVDRGAPCE